MVNLGETARKDWICLCGKPGAVVDLRGPTERYSRRVAVKKADLITHRDMHSKTQIVQKRGKEMKKPTDAQTLELEKALEQDFNEGARSRNDHARQMMSGSAVEGSDGAFSSAAVGALAVGDVKDLLPDSQADVEKSDDDKDTDSKSADHF